jgi:hypothetical protein
MVSMKPTAALLLLMCLAGCASGTPPDDGSGLDLSPGYSYQTVYLPYVEQVILPDKVYAGDEIEVTRVISSPLHPQLTSQRYQTMVLYWPEYDQSDKFKGYDLDSWMWGPFPELPVVGDHYTSMLPGLPAGSYKLRIASAKRPEDGGISGRYRITPESMPMDTDKMQYTEYVLTVLPKP